jgi:purine-binding chemotaxis protein CheW
MSESNHTSYNQIVVFTLDAQSYALSLLSVVKVIHAIEIKPLPETPEIIAGIVNVRGQIIPVADIRRKFGLAEREMDLNDMIIIADTGKREIAIPVDCVTGISVLTPNQLAGTAVNQPLSESIRGIVKIDNELIFIYNITRFLNLDEETKLEHSLKNMKNEL